MVPPDFGRAAAAVADAVFAVLCAEVTSGWSVPETVAAAPAAS